MTDQDLESPKIDLNTDSSLVKSEPQSNLITKIISWWKACPLFTKFIVWSTSILIGLSLFAPICASFANIPRKTLYSFSIYRLITSPYVSANLLELLVSYALYLPVLTQQEYKNGTIKTIVDFLLTNLEINILFIFGAFILSFIIPSGMDLHARGLFGSFFVYLTLFSIDRKDQELEVLNTSLRFKQKFVPWIAFVLVCFLSNGFRLDLLAAIAVAHFQKRYALIHHDTVMNDTRLSNFDASSPGKFLQTYKSYVSPGGVTRKPENDPNVVAINTGGSSTPSLNEIDKKDNTPVAPVKLTENKKNTKEIDKLYAELDESSED